MLGQSLYQNFIFLSLLMAAMESFGISCIALLPVVVRIGISWEVQSLRTPSLYQYPNCTIQYHSCHHWKYHYCSFSYSATTVFVVCSIRVDHPWCCNRDVHVWSRSHIGINHSPVTESHSDDSHHIQYPHHCTICDPGHMSTKLMMPFHFWFAFNQSNVPITGP